jgi:DNA-directed RNA polymerase subunit RPC12/RpoP
MEKKERIKLFSDNTPRERIKLFSGVTKERIKLFSKDGSGTKVVVCADCGYKFETEAHTTSLLCPKCGGTRFNVLRETTSPVGTPEKVEDRVKLFSDPEEDWQKEFSYTEDLFELKLKEFSGSSLSAEEFEKEFSALGLTAENLEERGFAKINDDQSVEIMSDAFMQSRLFSKLIVSVTKTLELDPAVVSRAPLEGITRLEETSSLSPKCIMLLKKAHGITTPDNEKESWLTDSGIESDLKLEFGGQTKSGEDFKELMESRYPDAPEGLYEILKNKGIIRESGDNIEIIK